MKNIIIALFISLIPLSLSAGVGINVGLGTPRFTDDGGLGFGAWQFALAIYPDSTYHYFTLGIKQYISDDEYYSLPFGRTGSITRTYYNVCGYMKIAKIGKALNLNFIGGGGLVGTSGDNGGEEFADGGKAAVNIGLSLRVKFKKTFGISFDAEMLQIINSVRITSGTLNLQVDL